MSRDQFALSLNLGIFRTDKAQYFDMAKGEFDMLYLCAGGRSRAMIFSFDKSTSLEGGSEKNPLR